MLLKLRVGILEGGCVLGGHLVGKRALQRHLAHYGAGDAGAVVCGEVLVAGGVAAFAGAAVESCDAVVNLGDLLVSERDAVGIRPCAQRGHLAELTARLIHEVVAPSAPVVIHGALLLLQTRDTGGGVETEDAGIAAVVLNPVIVSVGIHIAHLCGAVIGVPNGDGGGMSIEEAGIEENNKGDEQDNAYRSKSPAAVALGLFLRRFLFGESLFVGACLAGCLTLFLFS